MRRKLLALMVSWMPFSALFAQSDAPRWYLPVRPYSYTTTLSPYGPDSTLLPRRNSGKHNPITDHGATLGRVLFYDKLLSRNRTTSCASCHHQSRGFADGRRRSRGVHGRPAKRNSMAIVNLAYRDTGFFWDERAETLEQMVLMPIQDPIEMGLDLGTLVQRLQQNREYEWLFLLAFGDMRVTSDKISRALAQFVRSIVSLRSKYDVGLAHTCRHIYRGDETKDFANFTKQENLGKRIFFGVGVLPGNSCATCHTRRVYPAGYCCGNTSYRIDAVVLQGTFATNNGVDFGNSYHDPGRGGITGRRADNGKFRTPSLRNIALTGPYMHDGRFKTLAQVVRFYANRVRPHPNLDDILDSRSPKGRAAWGRLGPSPRASSSVRYGFPMNSKQRRALVAFLETLTDWLFVDDPRYSDPFKRRSANR